MVLSFSGDAFLARRAARAAARELAATPDEVVVLGEGMDPEQIERAAAQGGLFGNGVLFLDFDEAFVGQAGVKARNQALDALARTSDATVVVLDSSATPARQKRYRGLGEHRHLPTPRYERLPRWIAAELREAGVRFRPDVPQTLADLFGEEPAAIASEIVKLASLDAELDPDRVRELANRPAARTAFDLIERIVEGDAAAALVLARDLLARGEPAQRIFGALTWQFSLVADGVGLLEAEGDVDERRAAAALGAAPAAARRALSVARHFDEDGLRRAIGMLVDADRRAKSGGDPEWALEGAVLSLARAFGARTVARG